MQLIFQTKTSKTILLKEYNKQYYQRNKKERLKYMKEYRQADILCPVWMFEEVCEKIERSYKQKQYREKAKDIMCPAWMFDLSKSWKQSCYDRKAYNRKSYHKSKYPDIMCPKWMFS